MNEQAQVNDPSWSHDGACWHWQCQCQGVTCAKSETPHCLSKRCPECGAIGTRPPRPVNDEEAASCVPNEEEARYGAQARRAQLSALDECGQLKRRARVFALVAELLGSPNVAERAQGMLFIKAMEEGP